MILLHNPVPPPLNLNPNSSSLRSRLHFQCRSQPEWGTNAESVRTGRFGPKRGVKEEEKREAFDKEEKRKWWSDYSNDGYDSLDDEYDDFDLFDENESILDKFWILKVILFPLEIFNNTTFKMKFGICLLRPKDLSLHVNNLVLYFLFIVKML